MSPRPSGLTLPALPATFAALQAMQALILNECLVGGVSPFAPLTFADAARYGVANAVFVGRPKDFKDAYLPQCCLWVPPESERIEPATFAGRAFAAFEATVAVYADLRADWYAAEQQILAMRDVLWPVLLRHTRLGGAVPTVIESEARPGRGLCYEHIGGCEYRCYEAIWWVRQQFTLANGRAL